MSTQSGIGERDSSIPMIDDIDSNKVQFATREDMWNEQRQGKYVTSVIVDDGGKQNKLQGLINQLHELSEEDRNKLVDLLNKYQDIFSKDPGIFRGVEVRLQTYAHEPFKETERPIPFKLRSAVQESVVRWYGKISSKGKVVRITMLWSWYPRKMVNFEYVWMLAD